MPDGRVMTAGTTDNHSSSRASQAQTSARVARATIRSELAAARRGTQEYSSGSPDGVGSCAQRHRRKPDLPVGGCACAAGGVEGHASHYRRRLSVSRQHHAALPHNVLVLSRLEFVLACIAAILARLIAFCEIVLADKYSRHISTKIMEHASRLDLTTFEDPLFYDKMERARVQGTDRIVMIQSTGLLIQQSLRRSAWRPASFFISPWIF